MAACDPASLGAARLPREAFATSAGYGSHGASPLSLISQPKTPTGAGTGLLLGLPFGGLAGATSGVGLEASSPATALASQQIQNARHMELLSAAPGSGLVKDLREPPAGSSMVLPRSRVAPPELHLPLEQSPFAGGLGAGSSTGALVSAQQQQRRLAVGVEEAETYLFAVVKVRRLVAAFRQQMQVITDSRVANDPILQQLRELADALEAEVRTASACALHAESAVACGGALVAPGVGTAALRSVSSPNRGSYDMLRQSLQDEQRRYKSLNAEMLRQTQTNEELMGALNATKNSNKSLMEQVRQQSDEIDKLTRHRVGDEERMEDLKRRCRLDEDLREKEFQRRLAVLQEGSEVKCEKMRQASIEKMRALQVHIDKLQKDFGRLRLEHADQKRAAGIFNETAKQLFQQTEWTICQRLETFAKRQTDFRVSSSGMARELESRVAAEKEMRVTEVSSWSHRHALLAAERDDLQARLTRDVGQYGAQLQASERAREEERRRWMEEQADLCRQREDLALRCQSFETTLEKLRGDLTKGESAHRGAEQELRESEKRAEELRKQLRETDDSLAATVAANDTLRKEMEEQRRRQCDASDVAMASCKEAYEQRLVRAAEDEKAATARVNESLARANERAILAEERLRAAETELERTRAQGERVGEEAGALRLDLGQARADVQESCHAQRRLESELSESRHQLAEERVRLQGVVERLEHQKAALEGEAQLMQERLIEHTRAAADRDAQITKITGALEAGIRDRDSRLEEREQRLAEVRASCRDSSAEVNAERQRILEVQAQLERAVHAERQKTLEVQAQLDQTIREAAEERRRQEEERKRLVDGFDAQAAQAKGSQEQYERWRESHSASMRQVQEESIARSAALEQEREACRVELTSTKERLAEVLARLEAQEQDNGRLRYLLNESQAGSERVKKEKDQEERDASTAKQQLHEELRRAKGLLETVSRNEASLTQQLEDSSARLAQEREDLSARHMQDKQRADRELEDLRRASEQQLAEREQRIEWMKAEHEKRIQALESHHSSEMEREKARVDAALHQNEQLRRFFAEQKKSSSAGMSSLQSQLESSIMKLQQHTQELRGDLNRPAPPQATFIGLSEMNSPSRATLAPAFSGALGSPVGTAPAATGMSAPPSAMPFPNLAAPPFSVASELLGSRRMAPMAHSDPFAPTAAAAWRDLSPGFLRNAGASR